MALLFDYSPVDFFSQGNETAYTRNISDSFGPGDNTTVYNNITEYFHPTLKNGIGFSDFWSEKQLGNVTNHPDYSANATEAVKSLNDTLFRQLGVIGNLIESVISENISVLQSKNSHCNDTLFPDERIVSLISESQDDASPLQKIPDSFRKLSTNARNTVLAYLLLFCIGAPGNLFVFISVGREIWRRQLFRSRIKVLVWHLATADLLVTFVVIPIEVFWRLTIQWHGGNALCKLAQFFRAFGLYLSSMVVVCISLDRFLAIVFPMKVIGGMKRVRTMLAMAWSTAVLFALPQVCQ